MVQRMSWYLLYILLLACVLNVNAQQHIIQTRHYGVQDGLVHRSVHCILQDKQGFIWVGGSEAGISRFDGYSFVHYNKADNGLADDNVSEIMEAPDGMLWVFHELKGTTRNIDVFNPATGKAVDFRKYYKDILPADFPDVPIGFAASPDGDVYMGSDSPPGVIQYNKAKGFSFHLLPVKGRITVNCVAGNKLFLWITINDTSVNKALIVDKNTWQIIDRQKGSRYYPSYFRRCTADTGVYYSANKSYALINSDVVLQKKILPLLQQYKIAGNTACTFLDADKNLFLADSLIFDLNTGKPLLNLGDVIPSYVDSWSVFDWLVDRTGNLWLCSPFGLTYIKITPNRFKQLLYNGRADQKGIATRGLLVLPDNTLLVNTENNAQYIIDVGRAATKLFVAPQRSPLLGYAWGYDSTGSIYYLDKDNKHLIQQLPDKTTRQYNWQPEQPVWCMLFTYSQRFLAGTVFRHGILAGEVGQQCTISNVNYNGYDELKTASVYHIQRLKDGGLWLCAETGLYKLDIDKGIQQRYWTGGAGKNKIAADHILHFYEDAEGILWLATFDRGLVKWDPSTGQSVSYALAAGLPGSTVYCVYEDRHGQLWLSSERGILQFSKVTGRVMHVYGTNDGITNAEFNRTSHTRGADGTLYFGGLNGITAFNPDVFYNQQSEPAAPLVLARCTKYDGEQNTVVDITSQYAGSNKITLQPNDKLLVLDVALLSYSNTGAINYAYRFDSDSNWIYQTSPRIQFGGMPYGVHHIYVKTISANGLAGANQLDVAVIQLKPFYLRGWFLLLLVLVVVVVLVLFIRYRTQSLRKRQKEIEQEVKVATAHIAEQASEIQHLSNLKTRFFINVSHELRTPLTLIKGPLASLLKNDKLDEQSKKQVETADYHARQLLQLTNELLDLGKLDAGKMNLNETPVSLQPFMLQLVAAFENHAHNMGVNLQLHYNADIRLHVLVDTNKLAKVVNNLLSNAFKFTPRGGSISVEVGEKDNFISIKVIDTGTGIHPDDLPHVFDRFFQTNRKDAPYEGGTGIGLTMCRDFAQLMGGNVDVSSQPGQGSTFTVTILKKPVATESVTEVEIVDNATGLTEQPATTNVLRERLHTILLVEDNEAMRNYVAQILESRYTVTATANGVQALETLNSGNMQPDLILSDVMMPVMDGFELLGRLKAEERYRKIPVIMLTARGDMQDKLQALRIGVDDYLLKPFDEQELLARIDNLLANYALRNKTAETEGSEPEIYTPDTIEPAGDTTVTPAGQQEWLQKLEALIIANMAQPGLNVDLLATEMALSRSTFQRLLKRLTGLTPGQYMDEIRFNAARRMLETKEVDSVKAAAYSVGFNQVEHFSRNFHKRFGKYPSAYLV